MFFYYKDIKNIHLNQVLNKINQNKTQDYSTGSKYPADEPEKPVTIQYKLDTKTSKKPKNYFLLGLYTNLANPKIVIYFSSVFSLALSSTTGMNLKPQLAVIIPIQTFLVFSLLMLIMSIPKIKAIYQKSGSYIDILSGSFFLLFAIFLWVDVLKMFNLV